MVWGEPYQPSGPPPPPPPRPIRLDDHPHAPTTASELLARLAATICAYSLTLVAIGFPTGLSLPVLYCSFSITEAILWAPLAGRPIRLYARWAPEIITLLAVLHLIRLTR